MSKTEVDQQKIAKRIEAERGNVFARIHASFVSSRTQSQRLLQHGGGLSVVEWRTLWDLSEIGPMTIRDLARTQRSDPSQLSRALPGMRRKGLVSMERDAGDGRQTIVRIAEAGQRAFDRAAPVMAKRRAALRTRFSAEEMVQLVDFLDRIDQFTDLSVDEILAQETD